MKVPDLSAGWRMQYMQRAAHLLGRAMKVAQTGADYETSVSEGPRFFAQRAIASIHGKSEHEVGNNQRKLPDFVEQFPFMKDFATKSSNLFLDYVNDIPHKTFFGVAEGAELNMEILNDMNQLRLHLEDLIFDEAASKRETRFLVARYFHRANDLPPDETIKVNQNPTTSRVPTKLHSCLQRSITHKDAPSGVRTGLAGSASDFGYAQR